MAIALGFPQSTAVKVSHFRKVTPDDLLTVHYRTILPRLFLNRGGSVVEGLERWTCNSEARVQVP